MTVKDALKKFYRVEIELFLPHLLGKTKEFLFAHPEVRLSPTQEKKLAILAQRRLKGEPMAYLVGHKNFCGFDFKVNYHVLIPRPETEWLVQRAKQLILGLNKTSGARILDMGTGSGCIIVSLAKLLPKGDWRFYASDVSTKALLVAKDNARVHRVDIKFIRSDLFADIKGKFDLVLANLPYVPLQDYRKLKSNLNYEPKLALSAGKRTQRFYERFLRQLPTHCKAGASVLLEIEPKSKNSLAKWAKTALPKARINFYRDLGTLWRYMQISC